MFCKRCDQAYHSHCLQPPLKVSCIPAGTSNGIPEDVIQRTGKMAIIFYLSGAHGGEFSGNCFCRSGLLLKHRVGD